MSRTPMLLSVTFSLLALTFGASTLSASTTYLVGTCKKGLKSFPSIGLALSAPVPADVIEICPGVYSEQVFLNQPVTLEGISVGNSSGVYLQAPNQGQGPMVCEELSGGGAVAAEIMVNEGTAGAVNISSVTAFGPDDPPAGCFGAGIFYRNTPGTINNVATDGPFEADSQGNPLGIGIVLEGGSVNPHVTVENSVLTSYNHLGIWIETNSPTSEITATIKNNSVIPSTLVPSIPNSNGIQIDGGSTVAITGNNFFAEVCFIINGSSGVISGNTGICNVAAELSADGISIESNKFLYGSGGIDIHVPLVDSAITGNTFSLVEEPILLNCNAPNGKVHSNIIRDSPFGVIGLPAGETVPTTYINVKEEVIGCD